MGLTYFDDGRLARDVYEAASLSADPRAAGEGISRLIAPPGRARRAERDGHRPGPGPLLGGFSFCHGYDPALVRALVVHRDAEGDPHRPVGRSGAEGRPEGRAMDLLLAEHGAGSQLRLLLADARGVWGVLRLLRSAGTRPFGEDDARQAVRLRDALVAALRRYGTSGPPCPESDAPVLAPGVVVVGADHRVKAVSPHARAWHEQWAGGSGDVVPPWVSDLFFAGLSLAARTGGEGGAATAPLVCMPPAVCGRWLTCHAEPLDADGSGDVAVVVQGAVGDLVVPSFCARYGLTARERDVLTELRDGAAVKRIARRLGVSPYTVDDHLKAVFRKTGAEGRDPWREQPHVLMEFDAEGDGLWPRSYTATLLLVEHDNGDPREGFDGLYAAFGDRIRSAVVTAAQAAGTAVTGPVVAAAIGALAGAVFDALNDTVRSGLAGESFTPIPLTLQVDDPGHFARHPSVNSPLTLRIEQYGGVYEIVYD
ncbi:LuxR C-terminal-related transcriptional regulator [Streptomyces wedmorensis]